jgi:hypothetical protein
MTDLTDPDEQDHTDSQPPDEADGSAGVDQEDDESSGPDYRAAGTVVERNGSFGATIFVRGDFSDPSEGRGRQSRAAIPIVDITTGVEEMESVFVEPSSFPGTVKVIQEHGLALLVGAECGNRIAATMALRQTGHNPIVELPGALSAADLVRAVDQACSTETAGVLVDSLDPETLTSLSGFQLRHLRDVIPEKAALMFTARAPRTIVTGDHELPTVEGVPPDGEALVSVLGARRALAEEALERAQAARALLPKSLGPAAVTQLVALASEAATAEDLAAAVAGRSQTLDEWLEQQPDAKSVGALAAAAALDGVPSVDYDDAAATLSVLLEGDVEPPSAPPKFSAREHAWPAGVAAFRREQVPTYFGWQEAEIVEICPPHQSDAVLVYLWQRLGGDFRRPFLRWLRELPQASNSHLSYAAAKTAGILFAADPLVIERELLRPWTRDGSDSLRDGAGFALGMPAVIGADPTSARRLLKQWSRSNSARLREAAIVAYGGPLGIWDPSAAAVSHLWEAPWAQADLLGLANRSLAGLLTGGRSAGRARAAVVQLLVTRVESESEASRVYAVLPLALRQLTSGGRMARESLDALLGDAERVTRRDLAGLLARAFDSRDGREQAQAATRALLSAAATGRIGRDVVERLVREMKDAAAERGRLPQLGTQLKQLLKAEERGGGPLRDVARSIHETFYQQGQGGRSLETE